MGSIPGRGTKIPYATQRGPKKKKGRVIYAYVGTYMSICKTVNVKTAFTFSSYILGLFYTHAN